MPPSRRAQAQTADLTTSPPDTLPPNVRLARVTRAAGNNLFWVDFAPSSHQDSTPVSDDRTDSGTGAKELDAPLESNGGPSENSTMQIPPNQPASKDPVLVQLHPRFRSLIYLKRHSFVLVDTAALAPERRNKLAGEICNVVRGERVWRRCVWWPGEWAKRKRRGKGGDDGVGGEGLRDGEVDGEQDEVDGSDGEVEGGESMER